MISTEYAAGFFDGEGCVNLMDAGPKHRSKRPVLRVMLTNTFPGILERFRDTFGGYLRWRQPNGNRKSTATWTVTEGVAAEFLKTLQPYLYVKARQTELAIQFWNFVRRPYAEKIQTITSSTEWVTRKNGRRTRKLIKFARPEYLEGCANFKEKMGELNRRGKVA